MDDIPAFGANSDFSGNTQEWETTCA